MAENQDGQEKSEQPTSKRLEDAKRKGQVARSRELNTMALTLIGAVSLFAMSGSLSSQLGELMTGSFMISRAELLDPMELVRQLAQAIQDALLMLAPFFLIMVVVAMLSSVALGGLNISVESLAPKLSKLDPIKGMKKVFSLKGLIELLKALAKFLLVGGVTALLLWQSLAEFLGLSEQHLEEAVVHMGSLIGWSFVLLASTLILVAMVDVPFQLWDHKRQLKMTKQEIRDEMKETDGRPEVKGRIRQLQREMAQRRMMEEVPKADVIVTNPTHFAVALSYDQDRMAAPKIVAKGSDLVAANIRKVGSEAGVTVVESPPLARALYFSTEIGDIIPAGLYLAVAKLLAYVFQLRAYRSEGGQQQPEVPDLPIPEDLQVAPVE